MTESQRSWGGGEEFATNAEPYILLRIEEQADRKEHTFCVLPVGASSTSRLSASLLSFDRSKSRLYLL